MKTWIAITSFVLLVKSQPDPTRPIVPMKEYGKNARVLDCKQCFDAGGQMCVRSDYQSMFSITRSSDTSNGVCCKPDTDCTSGFDQLVCSMKSEGDPSGPFKDILTPKSNLNHQMFAFCPMSIQTKCGVTKKTASGLPDTNLYAMKDKQQVTSSEIKYVKGDSSTRRHDFCYYLIKMTTDEEEKSKLGKDQFIEIKLNTKKHMNVFIYEGMSKKTATKSVISDNSQPIIGTTYRVKQDSGLLVVSYPHQDKDASIDFQYWIGDSIVKAAPVMMEEDDDDLVIGISIAAGVALLLIFIIVAVMISKSRKNAVEIEQQYDQAATKTEIEMKKTDQTALDFEQGSGGKKDLTLKPGQKKANGNSPDTK